MTARLLVPRGRRLPTPGAAYVLGVAVLTAAMIALAQTAVEPGSVLVVVVAALGPFGVLAGLVLWILDLYGVAPVDLSLRTEAGLLFDLGLLAAALAVAAANVLVVARSVGRAGDPRRASIIVDRRVGEAAFITAGALFVALCPVAGSAALLAGGVDVVEPAAKAATTRLATGIAFLPAAVAAVRGRRLWTSSVAWGPPILRPALADLAIQTVALAGLTAYLAANP